MEVDMLLGSRSGVFASVLTTNHTLYENNILYNYDHRFARFFCDLIRDEIFTSSNVRGWL